MISYRLKDWICSLGWIVCIILAAASPARPLDDVVRIGILAKRGPEQCLKRWQDTAIHLNAHIPGHQFKIVPLDFQKVFTAVENKAVEFILTNSSQYVQLETRYGINRIATLKNRRQTGTHTLFGGLIFTRADRQDINGLSDLEGKTFMAVEPTSFGGWQMAWRELKEAGLDPFSDFSAMLFAGTHDAVVYAIQEGKTDAGTVRTDTLERMHQEKKIHIDDFHILQSHLPKPTALPFAHSTRAYPEWPMARVVHTPDALAEKLAVALIRMPEDSAAARSANVTGWTIPANYQSVHECLKALKIGPYKNLGQIRTRDVIKKYAIILVAFIGLVAALSATIIVFLRLNRQVAQANRRLSGEMKTRELLNQKLMSKNKALEQALKEIKALQGILPICSVCKKIRDDKGAWNQMEIYIEAHSDASFSHGICADCSQKLYGDEDWFKEKE